MSIIYIISSLLLLTLTILVKKSEEKLEIIKTLIIVIILKLSYNAIMCYILNLINVPITILSLSITNIIISVIIIAKILKDKQLQKYVLDRKNIIVVVFLILLTLIILFSILGNSSKIRYLTGDVQNHYNAVREFTESTTLSNKFKSNNSTSPDFMIMGYTNAGIICKILKPYVGTIALYNVFIVFEAVMYALAGISFYFLVESFCKNKYKNIITIIFTIIYILGYPLNAWISGFHYLIIGIIYVTSIIYAINEIKINFKYQIILMLLLNFGLIFSYCLFCPFVYLAEFIYYIYKYLKRDKRKLIYLTIFTLILPGILGTSYILIANFKRITGTIALEGYIYKNLWSNFILFIPFAFYNIYVNIKSKKISIENIMLVTLIIYMIILFIGIKTEKCSSYYLYKNYFVVWVLIIEMNIKGMIEFLKKGKAEKIIVGILMVTYITVFILSIMFAITPQKGNRDDRLSNTMEIFTLNNTMIKYMDPILTNQEYNLFLKMEQVINNDWKHYKSDDILFITDTLQNVWIGCFTGHSNDVLKNELKKDESVTIERLNNNIYEYIVVTKNTKAEEKYAKYINVNQFEIIHENEIGIIYKNTKESI